LVEALGLGGKLTASDAVHLATASWLEVNEMPTIPDDLSPPVISEVSQLPFRKL